MALPALINGKNYDWGNLQFILFGVPIVGITEISYARTRDTVMNYGAGNEPTSYGRKNYAYSGSITVYVDELQRIMATAPNQSILDIPPFSAINIFGGQGVPDAKHVLNNILFTNDPFDGKQNDTALMCKLSFVFAGLEKS